MNRIARTLVTSAPLVAALAVGGLSFGAGAASADPVPFGPTTLGQPEPGPVDPNLPNGPVVIGIPEPGPVDPNLPNGPVVIGIPEPGPVDPNLPNGPDTITNPAPCPTHGGCGSDPLDGPGDLTNGDPTPADPGEVTEPVAEVAQDLASVPTPTRVDAGIGPVDGSNGLEWLLLGGSLVGLSGAAYGARRLIRRTA